MNYVESGYTEPNYIEGDEISPTVSTCDLSLLEAEFVEVDTSLESLHQKIESLIIAISNINTRSLMFAQTLATLATKTDLQNKTIDLSSVATKTDIANLSHFTMSDIDLPSLNGRGCEHLDGAMVTVLGRSDIVYTVERSFVSLYSDNGYTVHYDLVAQTGHKVTVPEALLTKYIQTEV